MFSSFRARLIALFTGLVLVTQAGAFLLVNVANTRNATQQIARDLENGAAVFRRIIAERSAGLIANARLLSGDFAFKQAFASADHGTILSAMDNHLERIDADLMVLLDPEGRVIGDTLDPALEGAPGPVPELLARAGQDEFGEASGIGLVHGRLHQMTVVPLFTPEPSAWILFGFAIDDRFARELGKISEVSVLRSHDGRWEPVASTLPAELQAALARRLGEGLPPPDTSTTLALAGEQWVSLTDSLAVQDAEPVLAVLQRSLAEELAPYRELQRYLVVLFLGGLAISAFAAVLIARGVTRPVLALAAGVRRIAEGDYSRRVDVQQRDEIGQLAAGFNGMAAGLEERERVRNLLGKVVSPAIAEELLSRRIELGGEEREVSVLFADVRNFTALCEGVAPAGILALLNRYLTRVSAVIEAHSGVVDKYVGDAVMALFGAPLAHEDDAARAVSAALGMRDALESLNAELAGEGHSGIGIGIGINTATVVAGNMGSESRMNYTVIGDGVNLASRLESATRGYGVMILASEATRAAAIAFAWREVDRLRVKGKQEAVTVWEPLGLLADLDAARRSELDHYARCLALYRARDWPGAAQAFAALSAQHPQDPLYITYRARCETYLREPPGADWDGVFTLAK
ncbi:MAG: adenylate/guanylate cyclase domain-containing protein [Gammaproteobacteria bacterium]